MANYGRVIHAGRAVWLPPELMQEIRQGGLTEAQVQTLLALADELDSVDLVNAFETALKDTP